MSFTTNDSSDSTPPNTTTTIMTTTENGDVAFANMKKALLELNHHMVRKVYSYDPPREKKTKEGYFAPDPNMNIIDPEHRAQLDSDFENFIKEVAAQSPEAQAESWTLMFRYLFYLRNIRGPGKRERMLFFYLLQKVHSVFPQTITALLSAVPDYGRFDDFNKIINIFYPMGHSGTNVVDASIEWFIKNLEADCVQVFGKSIKIITLDESKAKNKEIVILNKAELITHKKGMRLSLAAKWIKREGKKDADLPRYLIMKKLFPKIYDVKDPLTTQKRLSYAQAVLRNIVSAITQLSEVGEVMMCAQTGRNWADINIENAPAGFGTKYRKALLNESKTGPSTRDDRIKCKENTLKVIMEGKLKGANSDLDKLSKIIYYADLAKTSPDERAFINQQWNDLVKSIREMIETVPKGDDYIDPKNIIPVVDTSGSMQQVNVIHIAIGLGILGATLSNIPGCLISFSDKPELFSLDFEKDIFDQFQTIMRGPMGYSTNIDATYRILLDLMQENKVEKANFALLFLTDCQFDQQVYIEGLEPDVDKKVAYQTVFYERMEAAFKEKGYTLPRTIFWNLDGSGQGFPALATSSGIQMVSGFSQTIMNQVMTGDFKLIIDEETGEARVSVDPWTSFVETITSSTFDPILKIVLSVQEGVMKEYKSNEITIIQKEETLPDLTALGLN
jgi:hypothetical protein